MYRLVRWTMALALTCCASVPAGASATQWLAKIDPGEQGAQGSFGFGVWPGFQDGWDGLPPADVTTSPGIYLNLFKVNGPSWSGPTGFYSSDRESPIPTGGSKTWSEIRLWSYNYTPPLGDRVRTSLLRAYPAPTGYWAQLVLDYVPASLNWTGPREWWFPLWQTAGYGASPLPCPVTDDPFNPDNVTRMHLTVYTIPEPCSLAGIGLALAGLAGALRRRRK